MMENVIVHSIQASLTYDIRQKVLWPDLAIKDVMIAEDHNALHFAASLNDQIVSIASVFPDQKTARLRKFATLPDFQGQGIGTQLLSYILRELEAQNIETLWCDAREEALSLYLRLGFKTSGERFFKHDIPYRRTEKTICL